MAFIPHPALRLSTGLSTGFQLNCRGRLWTADRPQIMGILNLTPDSFYLPEELYARDSEKALQIAEQLLLSGADILDVGGMSSRPGADIISQEVELNRVLPVIKALSREYPDLPLSVDTVHAEVARQSVEAGAWIVNDISAGMIDSEMLDTVAGLNVPYVLMHMKGQPDNMQRNPEYEDVVTEVFDFLGSRLGAAREAGITDIILDPGFGFGKTLAHNYTLLQRLHEFQALGCPLLAGLSRKSMIYKVLETDAAGALNGTTVLNTLALLSGAAFLRVHDPREALQCVQLLSRVSNSQPD